MRVVPKFVLNLLVIWSVNAVRISPKLDFGEPERKTINAGFRPVTEPRYLQSGVITKTSVVAQTEPGKFDNIGVICNSGNCATTKSTIENDNGISADVLVHIKTNVDVSKIKNDTLQVVPDVPIVVGSKTSAAPQVINNRPITPNFPSISTIPALGINTFIPSTRSSFAQYPQSQTYPEDRGYSGFVDYAPRYQGNGNAMDLQSAYFRQSVSNYNNYPTPSQLMWHPKGVGVRSGNNNPLEFRKTYSNTWSPVKWTDSNPANSDRRTGNAIPRWTPCVCQNPEQHRYPTTQGYFQSTQPSGINGKLSPLV